MEQKGPRSWFYREWTNDEIMKFYSIDITPVSHIDIQTELDTMLYVLLTYTISLEIIGRSIDQLFDFTGFMDDLVYSYSYIRNSGQWFLTSASTLTLNYKYTYNYDSSTATISNVPINNKLIEYSIVMRNKISEWLD